MTTHRARRLPGTDALQVQSTQRDSADHRNKNVREMAGKSQGPERPTDQHWPAGNVVRAPMGSWRPRSHVSLLLSVVPLLLLLPPPPRAFGSASGQETCRAQKHGSTIINLMALKSSNWTKYKSLSPEDCLEQCCSKGAGCNVAVHNPKTLAYQNCWLLLCKTANDCLLKPFAGATTFNVFYDSTNGSSEATSATRLADSPRTSAPAKASRAPKTGAPPAEASPGTSTTGTLSKAAPAAESSNAKGTALTKPLQDATKPAAFGTAPPSGKVRGATEKSPAAMKPPINSVKEPTSATATGAKQSDVSDSTSSPAEKPSARAAGTKGAKTATAGGAGTINERATAAGRGEVVAATATTETGILAKAAPSPRVTKTTFIATPPAATKKRTANVKIAAAATKPTALVASATGKASGSIKATAPGTRKPIAAAKQTGGPLKRSTAKRFPAAFPTTSAAAANPTRSASNLEKPSAAAASTPDARRGTPFVLFLVGVALLALAVAYLGKTASGPCRPNGYTKLELSEL